MIPLTPGLEIVAHLFGGRSNFSVHFFESLASRFPATYADLKPPQQPVSALHDHEIQAAAVVVIAAIFKS
jgi:hypothetical protein